MATTFMLPKFTVNNAISQGRTGGCARCSYNRGYRVEYCAASDALTYAPAGFYEFYTQRRRWTPSTMANILDLLMDWKHVIKVESKFSLIFTTLVKCKRT